MAEFFIIESEKDTAMDSEQQELLQYWRKLNKRQKAFLLEF